MVRTEHAYSVRITHRDAQAAFLRLCEATGRRPAHSRGDVGGWELDYAACYGGYVVVEQVGGGGESRPLGERRRSAAAFCDAVVFTLRVLGARS